MPQLDGISGSWTDRLLMRSLLIRMGNMHEIHIFQALFWSEDVFVSFLECPERPENLLIDAVYFEADGEESNFPLISEMTC